MNNNILEKGSSNSTTPQGDRLTQEGLIQIAFRNRWIIFITVLVFLAIAFIYISKTTPIYTSTSKLYVEQNEPKIISDYEGVMTRSKNYLYTQAKLIKSTPIVADVVDKTETKKFKTFKGIDNSTAYLKNNLSVFVGKKDDIITVAFDSPHTREAARIVNAVIDSYINYHSTRKQTTVSKVLEILKKEKVKRDNELSEKFKQLLEFTRKNGVVSFNQNGGNIIFQKLSKLAEALTERHLATVNAKADYQAVKSMSGEPAKVEQFAAASPNPGGHVFIREKEIQLKSELRETQAEFKNAKQYATENHPAINALKTKAEYIKGQIDDEAEKFAEAYIEAMRIRWDAAKQKEQEIQESFDEQYQSAQDLGVKATEYTALKSELERAERICEILDERIKELNVTEDTGALNISVLEVAHPASSPSRPEKAKVMSMALAFGLVFGVGLALVRDWLDFKIRSVDEVSAILGLPVLGLIPTMDASQNIVTHSQRIWCTLKSVTTELYRNLSNSTHFSTDKAKNKPSATASYATARSNLRSRNQTIMARAKAYRQVRTAELNGEVKMGTKTLSKESSTKQDDKIKQKNTLIVNRGQKVHLDPRSVVAEAYRTVRTAMFFGVPKGKAKTVLITSPASGDGKTTLVSNLAIAMAQAGQKTIIIDADLRKTGQHVIFQTNRESGLSNVIAGTVNLPEAIKPGPVKDLDLLTSGQEAPNPSEILNSDAFVETLKNLSEFYDRIIIDSAPVTPVADSQILAAICDVTVLVIKAEKSTKRLCQQARDTLLSVGGHLLGVVVNNVPRKRRHYGYYSGYGNYGSYGYYGYAGHYGNSQEKVDSSQNVYA